MAVKKKVKAPVARSKKPAASETSKSIQEQTKAFLKAGGEIEKVRSGVSGQQNLAGPKHITLGKKSENK